MVCTLQNFKGIKNKDQRTITRSLTSFFDVLLLKAVKPHLSLFLLSPTSGETNRKPQWSPFDAGRRVKLQETSAEILILSHPSNTIKIQVSLLSLPSQAIFKPVLPRDPNYVSKWTFSYSPGVCVGSVINLDIQTKF